MSDDVLVEETEGWKDLKKWLATPAEPGEPKHTIAHLADLLGLSGPAVRAWSVRLSRPEIGPKRDALCRIICSHPDRWMTKADREDAKKFAKVGVPDDGEERTGDIA
jgi:hypothetical protein